METSGRSKPTLAGSYSPPFEIPSNAAVFSREAAGKTGNMTKDAFMADLSLTRIPLSLRSNVAPFMALDVLAGATRREREGQDIVHLEIGEPGAPPPSVVREAAISALDGRLRSGIPHAFQCGRARGGRRAGLSGVSQHPGSLRHRDCDY